MTSKILQGYKVVELASVLAGPLAGSFLAELGATVVKVENKRTGGDVTRQWKLPQEKEGTYSAYYASANTGKEVILLDMKDESDYHQLLSLIQEADICISNYQKSTAEKLKLDYTTLKVFNPRILFAQLVAYSYDDPRPGYDLVMQAEAGFISMNGSEDGQLAKMPVALIDVIAGHQLKEAILLGLLQREKTGAGHYVEVSLYQSAISGLANQASNFLNLGHVPRPMGTLHPNIAPYGDIVTTADDVKVILSVGSDGQFEKLGKTLNFAQDSLTMFTINKSRVEHRDELMKLLRSAVVKIDYEQLSTTLKNANIPFCCIADLKTVFENPLAKQMIISEPLDRETVRKVSNLAFTIRTIEVQN